MSEPESRGARRRRSPAPGCGRLGAAAVERSRAYRRLVNPFEPPRIYSDDQVAAIHEAALALLETRA